MTIKIYNVTDDPKKLTKSLVDSGAGANLIGSYDVQMKEGGDILSPSFTVTGSDLHVANYCYIARYGRYYFIDPPKVDPAGRWQMVCHCDVLMSHATQLKDLAVTLDRSETIFNGYLPDSEYNSLAYRQVAIKIFPQGLTNNEYILITTG